MLFINFHRKDLGHICNVRVARCTTETTGRRGNIIIRLSYITLLPKLEVTSLGPAIRHATKLPSLQSSEWVQAQSYYYNDSNCTQGGESGTEWECSSFGEGDSACWYVIVKQCLWAGFLLAVMLFGNWIEGHGPLVLTYFRKTKWGSFTDHGGNLFTHYRSVIFVTHTEIAYKPRRRCRSWTTTSLSLMNHGVALAHEPCHKMQSHVIRRGVML